MSPPGARGRRLSPGRLSLAWLLPAAGLVAIALALSAHATGVGDELERRSVDARFAVRGVTDVPDDLVVVQVDDRTFSELGLQWPFPRSIHGDVVRRLTAAGASVIAYDVQFTEPTEVEEDNALIEAVIAAGGRVVLATTEVDADGGANVFGGEDVLRRIDARAAMTLLPPDPGGVLRRVPHSVQDLETFAVAVAEVAGADPPAPSRFGDDGAWIDYAGPPGTIRTVSFSDVLRGGVPDDVFRDRIVVVGASAPSLQDVHPTSASDEQMSGPEVQANAIATVIRDLPLRSLAPPAEILLIVAMGLVAPAAGLRLRSRWTFALAAAAAVGYVAAAQGAFHVGWVVPVVQPLAALGVAVVGVLAVQYVVAAVERERTRTLFARFVPDRVVDQVLARTDGDLRLGGVEMEATVMFSDLRGFTTYAERRPPADVIRVLNRYLSAMSEVILDAGGTLVAYMGDGIMAVFGAPLAQDDHADRALGAACEMLRRLDAFNAELRAEGAAGDFRMGIGLNSGRVLSGNVGSERRLEYAAIGDTTNTAARVEAMTKGTPHQLLVADSTRALLSAPDALVEVGERTVRGREGAVRLWTVPAADGSGDPVREA